ncbi:MAG: helix-turn-helix domain-containing protein [Prevotella sp.]|nr:helix-turn-helix domain-containing protein [Prevotella sp.]
MMRPLLTLLSLFAVLAGHSRHYDISGQRISTADGLPTNIISQVWQTPDGFVWMETRRGLARYDGYVVRQMEAGATAVPEKGKELRTRDAEWHRLGQGMLERRGSDGSLRSWQLIDRDIIAYTRSDHFHVADVDARTEAVSTYGNGLYLYDKDSGELTHVDGGVLDNQYLTGLFVDRTGCIWVTEDYLGVKCLRINSLRYRRHTLTTDNRLPDANHVRCVAAADKGQLLCSSQTGNIYLYDMPTATATPQPALGSRLYAALRDETGAWWLGTRGAGLFRDGEPVGGLPSKNIFGLSADGHGGILVSMYGGGVAHIGRNGTTECLLTDRNCHDMTRGSDGAWWVAAEDSLYTISGKRARGYTAGFFTCLLTASDGTVWAGGIGTGLLNCGSGERYTTTQGLANDNIYSIVEDRKGMLWMGTEEGLVCLNPKTKDVRNHLLAGNRLANVYSEHCALRLADGRLVFGTHDGMVEVGDRLAEDAAAAPTTTVTGMTVNGKSLATPYPALSHQENNVTFLFSNFEYARLQSVLYQYRLDGRDADWCAPTKEHSASYRELAPGRYVFRVRSNNGEGLWGKPAALTVVIAQPWWNTWWAWLAYVLLAAAIATTTFGTVSRILRLNRELDVERRVSSFKQDFYSRIERELRNPVNVLQGATENVQLGGTSKTTVQSLRRSSRRMLRLMDMLRQFHRLSEVEMQVRAEQDRMNSDAEEHFRDIVEKIRAEEKELKELAPPPINSQTLLIIEADDDNLTHLTDTLNPYFRIVSSPSMADALPLIAANAPSLAIIDISGQEKAGRQLTKDIHATNARLPIIHLAADDDDNLQLLSLRSGAADYMVKPFSGRVLLQRIARLFDNGPGGAAYEPTVAGRPADEAVQPQALLTDVRDRRFLNQFQALLEAHAGDADFSVEHMAQLMHLGRTQLYKRVKSLTGETPVQHLHRARLGVAARLLRQSTATVDEVMNRAGFHSATHFYNAFRKQYGMSPNQYRLGTDAHDGAEDQTQRHKGTKK